MPALYPKWSNAAIRGAILGVAAVLVAIPLGLMVYMRTPDAAAMGVARDQPVEFDHRHHVRDNGIGCLYCHSGAERAPHAGVPATEVCMGCHAQIWSQSTLLEPVRQSWSTGAPLPWNRVHNLPDFVYFDHSIHVTRGVACESCHGRVDLMPRVYQVAPLTMAWCLSCHRSREAVAGRPLTHCTTCHR